MKEHPILFQTQMVQAILEGRKTQTRRIFKINKSAITSREEDIIKLDSSEEYHYRSMGGLSGPYLCPYGKVGDVLWVREKFRLSKGDMAPTLEEELTKTAKIIYYTDDNERYRDKDKWKPSIFMPRIACRITLEITNVRVERLHDISESDAVAEGIKPVQSFNSGAGISDTQMYENYLPHGYTEVLPKDSYESLWRSINGEESWNINPFVWVIEFKKI